MRDYHFFCLQNNSKHTSTPSNFVRFFSLSVLEYNVLIIILLYIALQDVAHERVKRAVREHVMHRSAW